MFVTCVEDNNTSAITVNEYIASSPSDKAALALLLHHVITQVNGKHGILSIQVLVLYTASVIINEKIQSLLI